MNRYHVRAVDSKGFVHHVAFYLAASDKAAIKQARTYGAIPSRKRMFWTATLVGAA